MAPQQPRRAGASAVDGAEREAAPPAGNPTDSPPPPGKRRWLAAPADPASDTVGTGSGIALSCTALTVLFVLIGLAVWAVLRLV